MRAAPRRKRPAMCTESTEPEPCGGGSDARQRTSSQLESSRNALEPRFSAGTPSRFRQQQHQQQLEQQQQQQQSVCHQPGSEQRAERQPVHRTAAARASRAIRAAARATRVATGTQGNQGGAGDQTGQRRRLLRRVATARIQSSDGAQSQLDVTTSPQQDQSGGAAPDESSTNPYTSAAGSGNAQTAPQSVQPNYSSQPTQGNDSSNVPLGLRDLVKDYFSSLDQK